MNKVIIAVGIIIALMLMKKKAEAPAVKTAKGVNNPGNIRNSGGAPFKGETTKPGDAWKSFATPQDGYRAIFVLLKTYYNTHGKKTLREMIFRYAPPSENASENYVKFVADRSGVDPSADASSWMQTQKAEGVVKAITQFEQGPQFSVNSAQVAQARNMV